MDHSIAPQRCQFNILKILEHGIEQADKIL
jgi:hypothetical protein